MICWGFVHASFLQNPKKTWTFIVDQSLYETLGHTHTEISTAEDMGEYIPPKKGVELESNLSLTLSVINLEISLETHKIFHPEKH